MPSNIHIEPKQLFDYCRRHGIRRLSFFGSVLTDRFGPESDIDVLVEFLPGQRVGLFDIAAMEQELTDILGREVDLRTPNDLSPYFREEVMRHAEVQYAA